MFFFLAAFTFLRLLPCRGCALAPSVIGEMSSSRNVLTIGLLRGLFLKKSLFVDDMVDTLVWELIVTNPPDLNVPLVNLK